jgi:hypothetical protein
MLGLSYHRAVQQEIDDAELGRVLECIAINSRLDFYAACTIEPVMKLATVIELPVPSSIADFTLPLGVKRRLTVLLDRQDSGVPLTPAERREAEGLVEMAEFLSLLKLRVSRTRQTA